MSQHKPPLELIHFMAKTGFITHDLWRRHFCTAQSSSWARRLRNDFIKRGYIRLHPDKHFQSVYLLNQESDAIRAMKLNAVTPPPMTQLEHDECLADGIIQLERSGFMAYWQTEGELKKLAASDYRIETQGLLIKYPDLLIYTRTPLPEMIVAVEMERTLKTRKRYIQLLGAYASMKRIDALLYVVGNPSIERTIREVIEETYFPTKRIQVAFVSDEEWLKDAPGVLTKAAGETARPLTKAS